MNGNGVCGLDIIHKRLMPLLNDKMHSYDMLTVLIDRAYVSHASNSNWKFLLLQIKRELRSNYRPTASIETTDLDCGFPRNIHQYEYDARQTHLERLYFAMPRNKARANASAESYSGWQKWISIEPEPFLYFPFSPSSTWTKQLLEVTWSNGPDTAGLFVEGEIPSFWWGKKIV